MTDAQFLRMLASLSFMTEENRQRLTDIADALDTLPEVLAPNGIVKGVHVEGKVS